jgi:polysaccharide pyruvyl transferase WcaK-like protein
MIIRTFGEVQIKPKKISLFGNFGRQNLGNECTLQAILYNVRKFLPDAEINCICSDPKDTSARHKIPAFPISGRNAKGRDSNEWLVQDKPLIRLLRRVLIRLPMELVQWVKTFKTLKGTNMLVMTGTGMLGDFYISPFSLHYEILKWSIIAKMCRCNLFFVSVGASPLGSLLSRCFVKLALSLADYRSYRDSFSKQSLESIGFGTNNDPVYPDLAFSLPRTILPTCRNHEGQRPIVGIGLMSYAGQRRMTHRSDAIYLDYINKLSRFVTWLLENKYIVRLIIGDVLYDKRVRQDLKDSIEKLGSEYKDSQIIDEPVSSVEDLLLQLTTADIIVATRFHNLLLALMLNKPVVSVSYDEKIDSLVAEFGLREYCQPIDHLDVGTLIEQFTELKKNAENLKPLITQKAEEYRRVLDEQYDFIFKAMWPDE